MRNLQYENQQVADLVKNHDDTRAILRANHIDSGSRMSLSNALDASMLVADEVLALIEDRTRRAARRHVHMEEVVAQP